MENLSEENLLFQPYSRQFNVGEDCLKQAEVFELNTGLLIMVEFEQEIDDVLIAINDDDEEIETLYTS